MDLPGENDIGAYILKEESIKNTNKALYYSVIMTDKNGREFDSEKSSLVKIGEKLSKLKDDTNVPVIFAEKVVVRLFDLNKNRIANVKDVKVNRISENIIPDKDNNISARLILEKESPLEKEYKLEFTGDLGRFTSFPVYFNVKSGKKYLKKKVNISKPVNIKLSNFVNDEINIDLYIGDKLVHTIENVERVNKK